MRRVLGKLVRFWLVVVPAALLITACEANLNFANNSSQGDNDYFEEPISDRSSQYAPALETSNTFVELFAAGRLDEVRALFDPRLNNMVSDEQLQSMHQQLLGAVGSMTEYKPGQWGFGRNSRQPGVLVSLKIAMHERYRIFRVLKFEEGGTYDRLIGFKFRTPDPDERVAHAIVRAFDAT